MNGCHENNRFTRVFYDFRVIHVTGPTVGPLVPPTNLKSLVLSPRTVWLEWHDASLGRAQKITDGRYYIVAYKSLPDGEDRTVTVKVWDAVPKQTVFCSFVAQLSLRSHCI